MAGEKESRKRRVLICGGRDFYNYDLFNRTMDQLLPWFDLNDLVIIEGDADGADNLAFNWAMTRGLPVITMAAGWHYHGNSAGPIRNGWMLRFAMPDLVVAFPGGSGTANMIAQARKAGVDVLEVANGTG